MTFDSDGYQVVKGCLDHQTIELVTTELNMLESTSMFMNADYDWSDNQVEKSFSYYSAFTTESLLLLLQPQIEKVVGLKLYPSYSYMRVYYNGAIMKRHMDRESCQYSATLTISIDDNHPWSIGFKDAHGIEKDIYLSPGDMCVYKGTELEHWRDEYFGERQIQVFLHYVDANGIHQHEKYDSRPMLGLPPVKSR
jgi:alkylated DNA repair dioxygenase AlkB